MTQQREAEYRELGLRIYSASIELQEALAAETEFRDDIARRGGEFTGLYSCAFPRVSVADFHALRVWRLEAAEFLGVDRDPDDLAGIGARTEYVRTGK